MSTWVRQPTLDADTRVVRAVQLLTDVAPTVLEGVHLGGVEAILPVVQAPAGQTFTGAGILLGYIYVDSMASWVRAPRADLDCADLTGLTIAALTALPVTSATSWFQLVPSGVVLSGAGTTITTDYVCTLRRTQ